MSIPRWTPPQTLSDKETKLLARHKRSRKLFVFLRLYRHELFDDTLETELESIYRSTGAGKLPCPPALLAMAMLLQGYERLSDSDAVEHTASDARWQMVLDRMRDDEPAFAQSTLVDFRARLISSDMDRRILERTVELARKTGHFDYKKLPQTLRVAVDSAPLRRPSWRRISRRKISRSLSCKSTRRTWTALWRSLYEEPETRCCADRGSVTMGRCIERKTCGRPAGDDGDLSRRAEPTAPTGKGGAHGAVDLRSLSPTEPVHRLRPQPRPLA